MSSQFRFPGGIQRAFQRAAIGNGGIELPPPPPPGDITVPIGERPAPIKVVPKIPPFPVLTIRKGVPPAEGPSEDPTLLILLLLLGAAFG